VPRGQGVSAPLPSGQKWPGRHCPAQRVAPTLESKLPAGHGRQLVIFGSLEYVPDAQSVQPAGEAKTPPCAAAISAALPAVPGGQGVGAVAPTAAAASAGQ